MEHEEKRNTGWWYGWSMEIVCRKTVRGGFRHYDAESEREAGVGLTSEG